MRLRANGTMRPRPRLSSNLKPARLSSVRVRAGVEYDQLKGVSVTKAGSGESVELLSLWQARPCTRAGASLACSPPCTPPATQAETGTKVVIPFLTHFADLSSWEYAQKLIKVMPVLESSGVKVLAVGLGTQSNAQVC